MCKCIFNCFKEKTKYEESEKQSLKELFGVECDYLIEYNYEIVEEKNDEGNVLKKAIGYVVCLDPENDIDWKDTRDKSDWREEDQKLWSKYISRLDDAHAEPVGHLDEETIKIFKKKLGAGYVLCFEKNFDEIDAVINNALEYLKKRNMEESRKLFLSASTLLLVFVFALWIVNELCFNAIPEKWSLALLFGVFGSYFSIWTRYGKLTFKGLSSVCLHWLEALTRLIIGTISASVLVLAIDGKLIMPELTSMMSPYIYGILGFVGGFSERIIDTLLDKIVIAKK